MSVMFVDAGDIPVCRCDCESCIHNVSHFYGLCKSRTGDFVHHALVGFCFLKRVVGEFSIDVSTHQHFGHRPRPGSIGNVDDKFVRLVGELHFDLFVSAKVDQVATANPVCRVVVIAVVVIAVIAIRMVVACEVARGGCRIVGGLLPAASHLSENVDASEGKAQQNGQTVCFHDIQ